MADIKLQKTEFIEDADGMRVRILFADDPKADEANQTVQIDLPVEIEGHRPLFEYQAAALRDARSAMHSGFQGTRVCQNQLTNDSC